MLGDLEGIMLGEIGKYMYNLTYMWNLKKKIKAKLRESGMVVIGSWGGWGLGDVDQSTNFHLQDE